MILLYKVLSTLLYPLLVLIIYLRKFLGKEDSFRFKEKIYLSNFNVVNKQNSQLIWFHASSIGEFRSIIPIVKQLNISKINYKFLVTTTTLSSGNLAKLEFKNLNNTFHRYMPLDIPFLIENFLHLWKPDKIFLVDSEIWPNLILKAKDHKIPIALINARLTSKSFNKWIMFPNVAKKIFGIFKLCICSNIETKNFLEKLELKNIFFKGNIKFIGHIDKKRIKNINEKIFLTKRFWLAASTHKKEEIFCFKTHLEIKKKYKDIITIIAPRHIERSKEIKSLAEKFDLKVQVLNKNEIIINNSEIIIVNYYGALDHFYKYTKSVFIGKSIIKKLEKVGGQNPIEAAKLNCKIYHGPYVYNFEEIYKILETNNISQKVTNHYELSESLIIDLKNPYKNNEKISESIKSLEHKILNDTMMLVNNFLINEAN